MWQRICLAMLPGGKLHGITRTAKCAVNGQWRGNYMSYAICVYVSNYFDKDSVAALLRVLQSVTGHRPRQFKTDLATLAGIYAAITKNLERLCTKCTATFQRRTEHCRHAGHLHRERCCEATTADEAACLQRQHRFFVVQVSLAKPDSEGFELVTRQEAQSADARRRRRR